MDDILLLKGLLNEAVKGTICGKNIAIAFSGGLDSNLIAAIAGGYAEDITLYTVGTDDAHDVRAARADAEKMNRKWEHIPLNEESVLNALKNMIDLTGTEDPVALSFEIPFFMVCAGSKEKDIMTGQGADELFAGYAKYKGLGKEELTVRRKEDMIKLNEITIPIEIAVAKHFGKTIHYPFLNKELIDAVEMLDAERLMSAEDPISRKRVLREIAISGGHPEIALKEKKAAQYGSGAMAIIKKICKERKTSFSDLIIELEGRK